jgi:hypothetical protein
MLPRGLKKTEQVMELDVVAQRRSAAGGLDG